MSRQEKILNLKNSIVSELGKEKIKQSEFEAEFLTLIPRFLKSK